MAFIEPPRTAIVLGNKLTIKPVSWKRAQEIQAAQGRGDTAEVMRLATATIAEFVTMEDGTAIDADVLSVNAITEIIKALAGGGEEETIADFTATPD